MKHLYFGFLLSLLAATCLAQSPAKILKKKNLGDTVLLSTRVVTLAEPFDAMKALQALFPGEYYKLSAKEEVINWECSSCATKVYNDVNEDGNGAFPYKEGVATRLLSVMSFKDSAGVQYKMLAFNHSVYDEEGMQTSRFTGGLLGLAKFVLTDNVWVLKYLQPGVGAYGAFSQCPTPKLLQIGHDQYAFMIRSVNGGAPGPFDGTLYLVAGAGGAYRQMMVADDVIRTKVDDEEGLCSWDCEYSVPESSQRFFRDIVVTVKGIFKASDKDGIPAAVAPLIKGKKEGKFTIEQRYVYKGSKGYVLQLPVKAAVE